MKFTYASGARPVQGYTIRRGLGRGGFGEVYLAVSDGGKEVALKLVQQHLDVELRGVGQCFRRSAGKGLPASRLSRLNGYVVLR
jgi:hypothetical protein